jgi:hypothetical protein
MLTTLFVQSGCHKQVSNPAYTSPPESPPFDLCIRSPRQDRSYHDASKRFRCGNSGGQDRERTQPHGQMYFVKVLTLGHRVPLNRTELRLSTIDTLADVPWTYVIVLYDSQPSAGPMIWLVRAILSTTLYLNLTLRMSDSQ